MTDRQAIAYLIGKLSKEKATLEKRWRDVGMPDIPADEHTKLKVALKWLDKQMQQILIEEYGHPERGEL